MEQTINMTSPSYGEFGEIVRFDVTARCPYCDNETSVTQDEARFRVVQCQHCDNEFKIVLAD